MKKIFKNDWAELLDDELKEPYYQELRKFLIDEYSTKKIFPSCNFGARSVSRAGAGARIEFFCFAERAAAAVADKYF